MIICFIYCKAMGKVEKWTNEYWEEQKKSLQH
ncbi:BnaC04g04550D [Brassica napus]|uniref:BnaC04g04550D protein n=1 Tax=Brassica napus TaxID=3708 RepID=A0A078FWT8_BRANA|nr:BnaC04g04550D [Brassica napus]